MNKIEKPTDTDLKFALAKLSTIAKEYGVDKDKRKFFPASSGEDFINLLNQQKVKEFRVIACVSEFGEGDALTTRRYLTSFVADTPSTHIEYNIFHYTAKGNLSPIEKKLFSDTGIITAEKTLEELLKKHGEKMGGMSIIGPMAEISKKEIKRLEKMIPFSSKQIVFNH